MRATSQDVLLYDDRCPLCAFQTRVLTWLDWRHAVRFVPLSHPDSRQIAPTLTAVELRESIHCITAQGRVHRGARAIRRLGLRAPLLVPIGLLLWLPGTIQVAELVYRWVSRHRQGLSRIFGCKEACSWVPARERDGDLPGVDVTDV